MMEPFQVLDSKVVHKGVILDVVHNVISLPNGGQALREIVVHGEGVTIMPVDTDGRLIFVRQYRPAVMDYVLEAPAGMMEKEEKPEDCAVRELEEETGCKTNRLTFMNKMYASVGYCTEILYLFMAEELYPGEQHLDEDEFVSIEKYTMDEAVEMVFNGKIIDSKTIAAVMCCRELLARR